MANEFNEFLRDLDDYANNPKRNNRSERRRLTKHLGKTFIPHYNGKEPISFAEYIAGFRVNPFTGKSMLPRRLRNHPLNMAVNK